MPDFYGRGRFGARRVKSRALTLLELLVVVAILAVLSTIAIRSTADFGQQARYDATQSTLKTFRDGVLGPANQMGPTGIPMVTGFIADMGRPPRSYLVNASTASAAYDVPELYAASTVEFGNSTPAFNFHKSTPANVTVATMANLPFTTVALSTTVNMTNDATLFVPAGWRGPYITKPSGSTSFADGWGKRLVTRYSDVGTSAANWPTMLLIAYNGASAPAGSSAFSPATGALQDVLGWYTVSGFTDANTLPGDPYSGSWYSGISVSEYRVPIMVNISVYNSVAGPTRVQLGVYGPNGNMVSDGKPVLCMATEITYASAMNLVLNGTNAPTIGPRVFRAWAKNNLNVWVAGAPVYFPIRSGTSNVNLTVP